jgi:hypothetical protein
MRGRSSTQNSSDRFGQIDRVSSELLNGTTLFHWCVIEVALDSRVVVGVRVGRRVGQVSSLIASFYPSSRAVTTVDGDTFYLEGDLDSNLNARAFWMDWLHVHDFDSVVDVSEEYIAAMRRGLQ